jgi:voltage-gated potassium channel
MPEADANLESLENPGYQIFILALSVLSLANIVLLLPFWGIGQQQTEVLLIVDLLLTVVFLSDFAYMLFTAESKREYFLHRGGWLDLLGSLPFGRVFRIFRVLRVGRLLREYGFRALGEWLVRERAQSALYVVTFLVVLMLEVSSILMLPLEASSPDANITTGGDALWWGMVTVTTVGYGDQYPVTTGGRALGVLVLILGVALFGTFTGYLANAFLSPSKQEAPEAEAAPGAGDGSPRALIEEVRRELEAQETRSASLRARLEQLEAAL